MKAARSLLFVPAIAPRMLAGAAQRGADAVIVDLEDSVPPAHKADARVAAGPAIEALAREVPVLARVNAGAWQEDIAALPLAALAAVLLPKVESAEEVQELAAALAARCATPPPIAALIESALGVLRAERIALASPALCALGFGAEDFAAEMGVTPQAASLLMPAQQVTLAARAHGLACWGLADSIAEIEDMQDFAASCAEARAIGFTGTVCIHPRQVAAANTGFGATAEEQAWARDVLAAAEAAGPQGQGAFEFRGRMVDRPILERARRWAGSGSR
ncbi:CoA ester lyase [Ramlibacter sp. G-1-2-2]|uniref:CoA ester lyase n=1 Tax=Ramlibacter agri TaxID=2728837 RepID=A0A848H9N5_9BURK|nr:CoA ester lyase [Ramlibacter agri]